MNKKLGILGGMGPQATIHLYDLIFKNTPATSDQDHLQIFIVSDPTIPDRTEAILSENYNPIIEQLGKNVQKLEQMGAEFILIPCNTAHFFVPMIKPQVNVPILNMITITGEWITDRIQYQDQLTKIGLLSTKGTINSNIYPKFLKIFNFQLVTPSSTIQNEIMNIIYDGIKKSGPSPRLKEKFLELLQIFRKDHGVDWVILGCTELPLLFLDESQSLDDLHLIDPMEILAKKAVKLALG